MSANRWEFYLDARGLWCWRRFGETGDIVSDSKRCFPTRDHCVADAVKHGYRVRPSSRRQRKGVKWARTRCRPDDRRRPAPPGSR